MTDQRRRQLGEGWTQEEVRNFVATCFDRDAILDVLLGYSSSWFGPRMALIVGRGALQPYRVAAWPGLDGDGDLRKLRGSVASDAAAIEEPSACGTADALGLAPFFASIGQEPPDSLTTVSVQISGRAAIVLLGISESEDSLDPLQALAATAGEQLETLIKLAKRGELPPHAQRIPALPERIASAEQEEPAAEASVPEEESVQEEENLEQFLNDKPRVPGMEAASSSISDASEAPSTGFDGGSPQLEEQDEDEPVSRRMPAAGSPPGWEEPPSGRHTIRMELPEESSDGDVEPDDDEESSPWGIVESSSPRLTLRPDLAEDTSDVEDEGGGRSGPGATTFGAIPFAAARGGDGGDGPGSAASGPGPVVTSTIFGVGVADLDLGLPAAGSSGEGEGEHDAEHVEEAPREESVAVYAPKEVGDESSVPRRTLVGGIVAETGLIDEMQKARGEQRSKSASPSEGADEASRSSGPEAAQGSAESLPGAFILKRTTIGRRGSAPAPKAAEAALLIEPSESSKPTGGNTLQWSSSPSNAASPDLSVSPEPPNRISGERSEGHSTQLGLADHFVSSDTLHRATEEANAAKEKKEREKEKEQEEEKQEEEKQEEAPALGGPGASAASAPSVARDAGAERSEAKEKIDEEWFDYFSVEKQLFDAIEELPDDSKGVQEKASVAPAKITADSSAVDLERIPLSTGSYDEPLTIPPEAMERLLDSGPHAVELQEHFLDLDSRDRTCAFAAAEVVARNKEQALPILESMFPGRLFVDRYQYTAETLPPVDSHGPVLDAIVRIGDAAIAVVAKSLEARSLEARFYATFLLTRLSAGPLLGELYPRLFDRDQQTRAVALNIAFRYQDHPDFASLMLARMREELESDEEIRVEVAAGFLGRTRDTQAIAPLIEALGKHEGRANNALLQALQRVGLQSHRSPYEWRQWWEQAHREPRTRWLVEALDSASDEIRLLAFDEVQRLPGLDLNYHPHQPRKLRTRAQHELETWLAAQ